MGKSVKKISLLASGATLVAFSLLAGGVPPAEALIKGTCADCHTMHNSQNGASMLYGGGSAPNQLLTRGSCIGCHAQNTNQKIITVGDNQFPQVMHTDASGDLAAGNFAYITGGKGGGANQNKGHNIAALTGQDSRGLTYIPGGLNLAFHNTGGTVNTGNLTCAGDNGCHGRRIGATPANTDFIALKGAHHGNVDGLLNSAATLGESYRFLLGVKGLENTVVADRWQNASSTSHNEYFGASTPQNHPQSGCTSCHGGAGYVQPSNNTISGFCATCHGNFHTLTGTSGGGSTSTGIGATITSPFLRHPSDIVIKNSGEYALYTSYKLSAPPGRQTLPAAPSATVTPGSDTVTCLSCHFSHASNFPSMLRFDYAGMTAHNNPAASDTGCFACHTTKDQ